MVCIRVYNHILILFWLEESGWMFRCNVSWDFFWAQHSDFDCRRDGYDNSCTGGVCSLTPCTTTQLVICIFLLIFRLYSTVNKQANHIRLLRGSKSINDMSQNADQRLAHFRGLCKDQFHMSWMFCQKQYGCFLIYMDNKQMISFDNNDPCYQNLSIIYVLFVLLT